MPKLGLFEIEFDNPMAVYYAGTNLSGRVVIVLNEQMEMRGVRVQFTGKARTHWTESHSSGTGNSRTTHTDSYDGHENYFDHEITVFGNQRGASGPHPTMPAGTHSFSFSYPLPPQCPSSFEGHYGSIRYTVSANIDRPWKFDHKTKRAFTVLALVDLNYNPVAGQPYSDAKQKTLGCMCCVAGQINCQVNLPKQGYVPGEVLGVNAEITNNSSRHVEKVKMQLVQRIIFTASHAWSTHQKTNETILAESYKGEVEPGGSQVWSNEGLRVPAVPVTLNTCSIISIYYTLQFKVDPSGPSTKMTLNIPITIGSIPLRQQIPYFQQNYRQFSVDGGTVPPVQPTAPPAVQEYPDLPPPSYAEVDTGKVNIRDDTDNEHTRGQLDYAPRYPYYDWGSQQSGQPSGQQTIQLDFGNIK